ncbi:MAG: protoporphyrinogen oxidase [Opitutaceae bacterium]
MGNSSAQLPVAIIGGGITGLTAAYRLAQKGRAVRLFEASPRLGGSIRSERDGDWLIEAGPNSLQQTPALAALLTELGLDSVKLTARPEAKNRYIVRNGKPHAAPASPPGLITSGLFTVGGKLRLMREMFVRPRTRTADLSLADFGRFHFGRELVDYGLSPFVSGVYAGDAENLSTRHSFPSLWEMERTHGSIIRGQIAAAKARRARGEPTGPSPIISFNEGLETLPRALAARLPAGSVELNARVTGLTPPVNGQPWQVQWTRFDANSQLSTISSESFSSVILALPAAALANLSFHSTSGAQLSQPLAALSEIEYPPVSSLFLGYRRDQVAHRLDGFGMLVPPVEIRQLLGVLFNSTLFTRRAPDGHVALTVMTGGVRSPRLAHRHDADLLPIVARELSALLGVKGDPVFVRRNVWPLAIPQYDLGYERFLDVMTAAEAAHPGLLIGGHVRDGISMPNCIASGEKLASRALV